VAGRHDTKADSIPKQARKKKHLDAGMKFVHNLHRFGHQRQSLPAQAIFLPKYLYYQNNFNFVNCKSPGRQEVHMGNKRAWILLH
jgi:hypothetical protein